MKSRVPYCNVVLRIITRGQAAGALRVGRRADPEIILLIIILLLYCLVCCSCVLISGGWWCGISTRWSKSVVNNAFIYNQIPEIKM